MSSASLLQPEERVLSTLNKDGTRRWITPRVSRGPLWRARRVLAYALIAIFVTLPWITINGKPAILLDVVRREFTLFGKTFLPTDTLLLMLLVVGTFLTVFFATAVFGRVWCGWACPQTVYMEFVFRPIERWAEGEPGRLKTRRGMWRKVVKHLLFFGISFFLAHTFLSYFVGVEQLRQWVFESPANHPWGFAIVAIVTLLMLADFGYFREQICFIACPYGRFQSVMLDRHSLIVAYDPVRGEPRGKGRRKAGEPAGSLGESVLALRILPEEQARDVMAKPEPGDCVDCGLCVQTCPTGIDIRDGLQLECINCAQCIDACDAVMKKIGRDPGLIRYASQTGIQTRKTRLIRPRLFFYAAILLLVAGAFTWRLATMSPANVTVLRGRGLPFNTLPSGEISNTLKLRLVNRTALEQQYTIEIVSPAGAHLVLEANPMPVGPGQLKEQAMSVVAPRGVFAGRGSVDLVLAVSDGRGLRLERTYRLLGPSGPLKPARGDTP